MITIFLYLKILENILESALWDTKYVGKMEYYPILAFKNTFYKDYRCYFLIGLLNLGEYKKLILE